ncbi:GNAT family N-acetyltransferase [Spirosoma soli]|uniref:GNAT family N-acetyltransferase n=1 Tax=Spirosoma soli TaxID=1770529 RepID=A0ABW5M051_9BACT
MKREADPAAVALLQRTVYGTRGIRYQHTGQELKVTQLNDPHFFHLYERETLVGLYCLDQRPLTMSDVAVRGFYGRYLTVDNAHAGKGYGRLLKQYAVTYVETHYPPPLLFYSYIEEKNTRSLRISEKEGFQSSRVLKTFVFRRYAPQADPRFSQLNPSEKENLLTRLTSFYQNFHLTTFARIGFQNNYFVLKEGDEIIAGVQANVVRWKFMNMPGAGGWVMMNLLPLVSATRRFFDPSNYTFAVLEGLYYKGEREESVYVLLESVLAHFGLYTALLQIDPQAPYAALFSRPGMGRLSGYQKGVSTHVMIKPVGLTDAQIQSNLPVYVSAFDFS